RATTSPSRHRPRRARVPYTTLFRSLFRRGASARPDDLEPAMRRIEDGGARMGVLVEDLLLLARLDQGPPIDREPVDLDRSAGPRSEEDTSELQSLRQLVCRLRLGKK